MGIASELWITEMGFATSGWWSCPSGSTGNTLADANPQSRLKQLWVSAVDCCDGYCAPTEGGGKECVRAPQRCAALRDACTVASDCSDPSALCVGKFCSLAAPK